METGLLIDGVTRHSGLLIAQLATSTGSSAPSATNADQGFLDFIATESQEQS